MTKHFTSSQRHLGQVRESKRLESSLIPLHCASKEPGPSVQSGWTGNGRKCRTSSKENFDLEQVQRVVHGVPSFAVLYIYVLINLSIYNMQLLTPSSDNGPSDPNLGG
ncbi:hypothetical protein AMECASPLE_004144 [Ameca splendens]|uniref:Uncharacterized protein n=1 Tax=Ameca splendens TaxID=208324 RepID=A0ABV0YKU0_9TELE